MSRPLPAVAPLAEFIPPLCESPPETLEAATSSQSPKRSRKRKEPVALPGGMLVLSRHQNEDVIISVAGVHVVVRLLEIRQGKARIGFRGPPEATFHRREIWDQIQAEKTEQEVHTPNAGEKVPIQIDFHSERPT